MRLNRYIIEDLLSLAKRYAAKGPQNRDCSKEFNCLIALFLEAMGDNASNYDKKWDYLDSYRR